MYLYVWFSLWVKRFFEKIWMVCTWVRILEENPIVFHLPNWSFEKSIFFSWNILKIFEENVREIWFLKISIWLVQYRKLSLYILFFPMFQIDQIEKVTSMCCQRDEKRYFYKFVLELSTYPNKDFFTFVWSNYHCFEQFYYIINIFDQDLVRFEENMGKKQDKKKLFNKWI